MTSTTSTRVSSATVHQIKVTLKGIRPAVWRRFLVKSDINLHKLHRTLQVVMGWLNSHLYEFAIDGKDYGEPHPDYEGTMLNARAKRLNHIAPVVPVKFIYRYDFGDGWEHEIVVERILPIRRGDQHPICLAGKRACPPEDCGGIAGYADFLAAIRTPRHPEHESMLDWIGGEFDPEAFDLGEINAVLRRSR